MVWLITFILTTLTPRDLSVSSGILGVLYTSPNYVDLHSENGQSWEVDLSWGTPSQLVLTDDGFWVLDHSRHLLSRYTLEGILLESYSSPFSMGQVRELEVVNGTPTVLDRNGVLWQLFDGEWTSVSLESLEFPLGFTPLSNGQLLVLDRVHSGFWGMKMVLKHYDLSGTLFESSELPTSLQYGVDLYAVTDSGPYIVLDAFMPQAMRISAQGDSLGIFELPTSGGIAIGGPWQNKLWVITLNNLEPIAIEEPTDVAESPSTPNPSALEVHTLPGKMVLSWTQGEIQVFDILGRKLYQSNRSTHQAELLLRSGIYFVRYQGPTHSFTRKVLIFPKGGSLR